MKKRLALSVLAGFLAALAVAWFLTVWGPLSEPKSLTGDGLRWPLRVPPEWPEPKWRGVSTSVGAMTDIASHAAYTPGTRDATHTYGLAVHDTGWPLRAFRSVDRWSITPTERIQRCTGLVLPGSRYLPRRSLPVVPLWPGVAVNTALYGAIAFLLWSAPQFARQHRRRGPGHRTHARNNHEATVSRPDRGF